jgi:prepilin-type N-terminal cleavage/methylation domain-containing protein
MKFFRKGFTLMELMVSITVLMLISTATVFGLRNTRAKEELQTAARLLAGDIQSVEIRALAGANVKACTVLAGIIKVCEAENPSAEACVTDCEPTSPPRFGVIFSANDSRYSIFADTELADWRLTSSREVVASRTLNTLGSDRVALEEIETELGAIATVDIGVERQSGRVRINACGEVGLPDCAPTEPQTASILLRHLGSNQTATVKVNAVSGRVTIE